jgi:hypothetical protein
MKKLLPVLFVLVLASIACVGLPRKATPTSVPPLPTEIPTSIPPTPVPPTPTDLPTPIPPTAVPPTDGPAPTKVVPTQKPVVPTEQLPETSGHFVGYANGTEIVYEEDFSNPKQDWELSSSDVIKRSYENGEFLLHLIEPEFDGWNFIPDATYTDDVILDVDVRGGQNFPEDAVAGFVCGLVDNENFYGMGLGSDGWMEIIEYKNDERTRLYSSSDVVPLNPAGTHLTGVCTQSKLELYADSQLVGSVDIPGLPAGTAGLFGASHEGGDAKIYFDNLVVSKGPYSPDESLGRRGTQLLRDDFSNENTNWDVRTADNGSLSAYENGEYHMKVFAINYDLWSNPNDFVNAGDVIVDVDVKMGDNPLDNTAAIICNYDMDTHGDFGVAGVNGEGYAQIYEYVGGEISWLFTSETPVALNPQLNHLTVHCIGSSITLLVNNRLIGSAVTNVNEVGNVGLLTGSFENIPADFLYDNFEVYSAQ